MNAFKTWFESGSNYGKLMIVIGFLVLFPVVMIPFDWMHRFFLQSFAIPALISILCGFLVLVLIHPQKNPESRKRSLKQSAQIVVFGWFWAAFIGALPFILSDQLSFLPALFESVSGWTTAGLSVMDVQQVSPVFLFYRSFMQFCGGLGFVFVVLLLVHDRQSMNLYNAEGHPDRLEPSLKKTAWKIFELYLAMLAAGVLAYMICGMPLFDGINHAMCALSTGGFSIKLNSIGEYDSLAVETVTIILMLAGTTNFAALFLLLKGRFRRFFEISEVRLLCVLLIVFVPLCAAVLALQMPMNFGKGFRESIFAVISALSTAGFSLSDFSMWPPAALGILILMMLIGGGMGSTAGGMKLSRIYIMLRTIGENLKKRSGSGRRISTPVYTRAAGKAEITPELVSDTASFTTLYLLIYILGSVALTFFAKCSLQDGLFEFASALGTVGLSIGVTSLQAPAMVLIIEIIGMFLGRLEVVIIFVMLYSGAEGIKSRLKS